MFGETVARLIRYLAPLDATDLIEYGYDTSAQEDLLAEKALIVFSYLPQKYRNFYAYRVYRFVLESFSYQGQIVSPSPFSALNNIVGYLNPTGKLIDLKNIENINITYVSGSPGTLIYPALAKGDKIIIDFSFEINNKEILPLIWATNVLCAIDLMSTISGEAKSAELIPRIRADSERVFPWLEALNTENPRDRVVIKDLEYKFWEGDRTFSKNLNNILDNFAENLTL